MKGSLNNPPIVVRGDRGKAAVLLLGCALFVAGGMWMALDRGRDGGWGGYLCAGVFSLGVFVGAWQLVFPNWLEISPAGFSTTTLGRTHVTRWADVAEFGILRIGRERMVGLNYAPGYAARAGLRRTAIALSGMEGSLGGGWEIAAPKLLELLNQAKARWGEGRR
jgi:hypothetical protein